MSFAASTNSSLIFVNYWVQIMIHPSYRRQITLSIAVSASSIFFGNFMPSMVWTTRNTNAFDRPMRLPSMNGYSAALTSLTYGYPNLGVSPHVTKIEIDDALQKAEPCLRSRRLCFTRSMQGMTENT